MPAIQAQKQAPRAKRKKRMMHTFQLLQPFFQFLALMIVVLSFVRCSPLAPSTDKGQFGVSATGGLGLSGAASEAMEQTIRDNLKEVSTHEAQVVSETDFRKVTEDVKSADDAIDENQARNTFQRRRMNSLRPGAPKLFFLELSADRMQALLKDGKVRVDLNQRISNSGEKSKIALFRSLKRAQKDGNLDASGYFVMPDATMKRVNGGFADLQLLLKISIAQPSDAAAYLEISHAQDDATNTESNAILLDAVAKEALKLAIVLE